MKGLANKRHNISRIKAKVKRIIKATFGEPERFLNPTYVGKAAAVHLRGCACNMCKNKTTQNQNGD